MRRRAAGAVRRLSREAAGISRWWWPRWRPRGWRPRGWRPRGWTRRSAGRGRALGGLGLAALGRGIDALDVPARFASVSAVLLLPDSACPASPPAASAVPPSSQMGVGCGGRISIVSRSVDRSVGISIGMFRVSDAGVREGERHRDRHAVVQVWVKPVTITSVPVVATEVDQGLAGDHGVADDTARTRPRRAHPGEGVRVEAVVGDPQQQPARSEPAGNFSPRSGPVAR